MERGDRYNFMHEGNTQCKRLATNPEVAVDLKRNRFCFFILVVLFVFSGMSICTASEIAITLEERAGVNSVDRYVDFGLPIPRSWNVTDASTFRLLDGDGTPIPAQFEALARWGGHAGDVSAPIRWVLVGLLASVDANGSETCRLDTGGPGPAPATAISIDTGTPGKVIVNTGAARFEINSDSSFNLFQSVIIGERELLFPLTSAEAIAYAPAGALSVVEGGTPGPDYTPRTTSVEIERTGPLSAVLRVEGSILNSTGQAVLDFTARFYFTGGKSDVRLDFTVENNHSVIPVEYPDPLDNDQPENAHEQGAYNSVYIGSLKLALKIANAESQLRVLTENSVDASAPSATIRLFQDSSGTDYWDAYVGMVGWEGYEISAHPRLQSYCDFRGYTITGSGISESGNQAVGWMSACRANGSSLLVSVRDFWENFPEAIEVTPQGVLSVDLFPNGEQFRHNFRVGEEKTHTLYYQFKTEAFTESEAQNLALAFDKPVAGHANASWYVQSGAMGEMPAADADTWPLYERFVRVAFEPNPDFDPFVDDPNFGNSTLVEKGIIPYNFFGWQDYGDVPLDYEGFGPNQAGQMNLKYWFLYGFFAQYARSADPAWLDLALPAAWHMADIDYLHIPDEGIQHWVHGTFFGHSAHDEPGCTNPNRNYNSPNMDLSYGVPGLLAGYCLTGERRFLDTAREGLDGILVLSHWTDYDDPAIHRECANTIFPCIEGYRQTGDARYLDHLEMVVGKICDLSNKQWLDDPCAYSMPAQYEGRNYLTSWGLAQTMWTLGRYLDFLDEYGLEDELNVENALLAFADFIIDYFTVEFDTGRYCAMHEIFFDGCETESYEDVNSWTLVIADALAYAYKYSNDNNHLLYAGRYYETGTVDQVWEDDPPVYMSTKDLVNSLNWGMVYMNQTVPGELYVCVDGAGACPACPGIDPADCFMTVQDAINAASGRSASTEVRVAAGDYPENIVIYGNAKMIVAENVSLTASP